jgi:hypothetical protein
MSMGAYFDWLVENTKTTWWHNSGDRDELTWSLEHRASGVTTNPVLIAAALRSSGRHWRGELESVFSNGLSDEQRAAALTGIVVRHTAARLEATHNGGRSGREGYVCAQVNPGRPGDRAFMRDAVRRFHALAPNISVKVPAAPAGLDVAEECIAEGISMTITVSFTVAHVLAIGAMHQRARGKAEAAGVTPGQCNAVVMIGRIDDYLRDIYWPPRGGGLPNLVPESSGSPQGMEGHVIVLPFNDVEALERTLTQRGDQIAAVILEPVNFNSGGILPQPVFLDALRSLTTAHEIVLIFDEILSGFRTGPGCMQEYLGVTPDLCTLGRAIGGELPLSAFAGRADIMNCLSPLGRVSHSGTYLAHPTAMFACNAFLDKISQPGFWNG